MNGVFQKISDRIDLKKAQKEASVANDLLPPREDDHISGELGKRFAEHLRKNLEEGRYEPDQASFVQVPKPGFTSRPAALLTLVDRVVYEALVDVLRPRLAKYLIDREVVLWPREMYVAKQWVEFEKAPLRAELPYIVQADVAGFYDSIDHDELEDLLVRATGEREVASAIRTFLSRIMASRRGIPQGLLPSDTLATTFLQPVDAALLREGFGYWRHGDDMRVAAETISRAREAIFTIELALRAQGLLVNGAKCAIIRRTAYESELVASDAAIKTIREKLLARRIRKVTTSEEQLVDALKAAELDEQWAWDLFYHHSVSINEVIDLLRTHLEPSDVEIAEQVFRETMKRSLGEPRALPKEQFHQQLTRSLLRLAAGRSPAALAGAASIVAKFPEKTDLTAGYLQALLKTHGEEAVRQVESIVNSDVFTTPWQQAWLLRVLAAGSRHLASTTVETLRRMALDEAVHWLSRVEAMKVLAQVDKLDRDLVTRAWRLAPRPYRCDLLAAAASLRASHDWARRLLDGARQDPVEAVVAKHLTR